MICLQKEIISTWTAQSDMRISSPQIIDCECHRSSHVNKCSSGFLQPHLFAVHFARIYVTLGSSQRVMGNKTDPVSSQTTLPSCWGEPRGPVGWDCQHIKIISQTFPGKSMQITAARNLPLRSSGEEKNRKTASNERPGINCVPNSSQRISLCTHGDYCTVPYCSISLTGEQHVWTVLHLHNSQGRLQGSDMRVWWTRITRRLHRSMGHCFFSNKEQKKNTCTKRIQYPRNWL